jgi:hypothetical protein
MSFAKNKEERTDQKQKQIAHKIKLKKRLEKAKSKISPTDYIPNEEREEQKSAHSHQLTKPNPAKRHLEKAKKENFRKDQEEFERQIMEKRRQQKISEGKNRRRREKHLLYKKTTKGQPLLSHQITHLLSKIQK